MKKPRLLLKTDITRLIESALAPGQTGRELPSIAARNALLVSLLYYHALRLRDVQALGWGDIDPGRVLQTSAIPAPGRPLGLYRHEGTLFYLWRRGWGIGPHSGLVFPMFVRRFQQILADLGTRAELGPVSASDLRYSRARHLADNGAGLPDLQTLLGLRTAKAAQRYLSTNQKEVIQ